MTTYGHHFVSGHFSTNPYRQSALLQIVAQLERCGYRCEAGSLTFNLAFQELKRRAMLEAGIVEEQVGPVDSRED